MTVGELYKRLLKCLPSHLDAVTVLLDLDTAYLPDDGKEPATRAKAILKMCKNRGPAGLAALEAALDEVLDDGKPSTGKGAKGRRRKESEKQNSGGELQRAKQGARDKLPCILVLAANPVETDRLRLDREVKLIKDELRQGDAGRRYRVETEWAATRSELSRHLLAYRPTIVHFSGHGSPTGEVILEAADGRAEAVAAAALAALFDTLKGTQVVVLNACYSDAQADVLARAVPHVVGMAKAIGDESALRFAAGFYRALAFGEGYATAYQLGCAEINLAALPDAVVPHFTTQSRSDSGKKGTGVRRTAYRPLGGVPKDAAPSAAATRSASAPRSNGGDDTPHLYQVWYGTNRRPVDSGDVARGFTGERDDGRVHYGTCKVAVPKSHKIGSIGSSWWRRILAWEDDRLKLIELAALAEADFWGRAREAVKQWKSGERRALVFIHGYNVSFEAAALRAAQIGVDLKVPGITAFYSWPSKGSVLGYPADEATIEASEGQITEFLARFANESGAERVDVLAHSMGNRGLLRALQRMLHQAARAGGVPFGQLILAAPDIDADLFRDLAIAYAQVAQRTTLYVSSKDKALAASGIVHDHPRAGYTPPVMVIPGIDTVEVSNIDLTFLGHGYYAAARNLLHDMHSLIMHGEPPEGRLGLKQLAHANGRYWQIGA